MPESILTTRKNFLFDFFPLQYAKHAVILLSTGFVWKFLKAQASPMSTRWVVGVVQLKDFYNNENLWGTKKTGNLNNLVEGKKRV